MNFYFSRLSIFNSIYIFRKVLHSKKGGKGLYYIDKTISANILILFISSVYKIKFQKLEFELRKIKTSQGELRRFVINRKISFATIKNIIQNKNYIRFTNSSWDIGRIRNYIEKSILEGYVNSKEYNYPKILYLIHVVSRHNKKSTNGICTLVISRQPWHSILSEYAMGHHVKLMFVKSYQLNNDYLKKILIDFSRKNTHFFVFIRSFMNFKINFKTEKTDSAKIYIEGRGNISFNGRLGYRSDLFLLHHSQILPGQIAYTFNSMSENKTLEYNGIYTISGFTRFYKNNNKYNYYLTQNNKKLNALEYNKLKILMNKYKSDKGYWYSLFRYHNIKIHLTWYDNNSDHMVIADAINDTGGIATMWQTSFYGFKNYECKTNTDIMFHFAKFDAEMNQSLGSRNHYNIITGFITDYSSNNLLKPANEMRNKLKSAGAIKIVNVMDENCSFDDRWHTGPKLQRENYSVILDKVLKTPWLGVVFKPKKLKTLQRKLGPVYELLNAAIKTGRCIVLDESGFHVSSQSPLLAGMVADVSIHGHLFAGTAALECALQGKKTLLIDREGALHSKLHELPKGNVIFDNWSNAIEALMNYFEEGSVDPKFGNWSNFISKYDCFNDNKGSYRMSLYMQDLLNGFENGLNRNIIMADAAQKYADRWGNDKVISA